MNTSLRKNAKYRFIRSALAKKYDRAALADILRRAKATTPPSPLNAPTRPPASNSI